MVLDKRYTSPDAGTRFGARLEYEMGDGENTVRGTLCRVWRDISGPNNWFDLGSCTGGELSIIYDHVVHSGPYTGDNGQDWYRYTVSWESESLPGDGPYTFTLEADGHKWNGNASDESLCAFIVDLVCVSDESGNCIDPAGINDPDRDVATTTLRSFPNPFSRSTTIHFDLPRPEQVTLEVYDVAGRLVRVILDRAT
jgi:hypothetical protein